MNGEWKIIEEKFTNFYLFYRKSGYIFSGPFETENDTNVRFTLFFFFLRRWPKWEGNFIALRDFFSWEPF